MAKKCKIGIVVPATEVVKVADILRKEGLNPIVSGGIGPIIILEVSGPIEEMETLDTKVNRALKKEAIDYHHSN